MDESVRWQWKGRGSISTNGELFVVIFHYKTLAAYFILVIHKGYKR